MGTSDAGGWVDVPGGTVTPAPGPEPAVAARQERDPAADAINRWLPGAIAAAALAVLVYSVTLPLAEPLRGDELISLFRYSSGGPSAIWSSYIPNDHMLYELLTWALRSVSGDSSPASVRFWAVIPSLAAAGGLTLWLWRRLGPWVAAVFASLVAAAPVFLVVAEEGRGYGLGFLAAAIALVGADWAARGRSRAAIALFAVGAIAGTWTLPIFVLAVVVLGALLLSKLGATRDLLFAFGVIALSSLFFYLPVLGDLISSAGQHDGHQLGLFGFATGPLRDLLQPSAQAVLHPVTPMANNIFLSHILSNAAPPTVFGADLVAFLLVGLGTVVLLRDVERFLAAALLAPAVISYLVLEIVRSYLISRFASFVLPSLLILAAVGLVGVGRVITRTRILSAVAAVAGSVLCLLLITKAYSLATINGRPSSEKMYSNQPSAFAAYVAPVDVQLVTQPQLQVLACNFKQPFVLLDYQLHPFDAAVTSCLRARPKSQVATLKVASPSGRVPAVVYDVPGRF